MGFVQWCGVWVWDVKTVFSTCLLHLKLIAIFLTGLSGSGIARQPVTR